MIEFAEPSRLRAVRPVSLAVLALPAVFLGYLSGFPGGAGFVLMVAAVAAAGVLRASRIPHRAAYAPVPVLIGLLLEAVAAPVGFGTEVVVGLAGVAFLVWLADDPARPAGGAVRGLSGVALPALALGIAWSSALFLPSGVVPLGVAGALLALAIAAVAFLVGRPSLLDRGEARS
ncbi:MAG TPA: hypothetical protein VEG66_08860 [Thermoplasmata archaeon]|jgi:hypothetical protein|nr:hypothetical protein [Thermoplasmata archaeon]